MLDILTRRVHHLGDGREDNDEFLDIAESQAQALDRALNELDRDQRTGGQP
jgi:hypothetical protein